MIGFNANQGFFVRKVLRTRKKAGLLPIEADNADSAGTASIWTENAMKLIYRDNTKPEGASDEIRMVAAKNEYESVQIALRNSATKWN
ncbi:hypothetical protein [Bacillus sp. FJAT-28004]|uniref:hypothetical protein n=1 Tax=Bacillus sp. FJAT-28004 TaxID=1679165 RepID=UPI0006B5C41A|nr:hypothetical protein [Bacillus sp. FJAT-28004]